MFCAHLDTVPHDGRGRRRSSRRACTAARGDTILGADNKAAVTVLVELAARHSAGPAARSGSSSLFTVAEEDGLRGAKAFDISRAAAAGRLRARPRDARSAR